MRNQAERQATLIRVRDGRRIAVAEYGSATAPVTMLYFHATLSSRLEGRLFDAAARRHGVRVIAVDRPGAGRSDPHPGRRLLDWPDDVAAVADQLGIARFAAVGQSVGAAHALACAHRTGSASPSRSTASSRWSGSATSPSTRSPRNASPC